MRHNREGKVYRASADSTAKDAGQAEDDQRRTSAAPAKSHSGSRAMVADRVVGALSLFWRALQRAQAGGIPLPDQPVVVPGPLPAQPETPPDAGTDASTGKEMASLVANRAFISRFSPVRQYPR